MKNRKILFIPTIPALLFFIPFFSFAQTAKYTPLADYDGILEPAISGGFSTYLNTMMGIMIAVAAVAAVVMIVAGGLQYMTTDAIQGKQDGKKRITSAIGGLILALSSWLILQTINPNILKFDFKVDNVAEDSPEYREFINMFGGLAESTGEGIEGVGGEIHTEEGHDHELRNKEWSPDLSKGPADPGKIYTSEEGWPGLYLNPNEMRSRGDGTLAVQGALINAFDQMRTNYGGPIGVNSGYRDPDHNSTVGGASNSQHVHGNAVDLKISSLPTSERERLLISALDAGFTGIGVGNNVLHVDVAKKRYWGYNGGTSAGGGSVPGWAVPILKAYDYKIK